MALTICNCVLKVDNMSGIPYSTAELVAESRKTQVNSADAVYLAKPARTSAQLAIVIQDLLYLDNGVSITPVTVTYTTGAVAGSEVVTVLNTAITVQIESGVSTASQIKAAILNNVSASTILTVILSGTSSSVQTSVSATELSDYYFYLSLAESTTNAQLIVFRLNWYENTNYGSVIFDPIQVPNQSYVDLSTLLTVVRG